jgi:hypothetical protein
MTTLQTYLLGDILVGGVLTIAFSESLHFIARKRYKAPDTERILWMPALVGALERVIYTLLVHFAIPGAAGFIGSWVVIKAVGGWANFSMDKSQSGRVLFSAGLMGSALSIIIGILTGLVAKGTLHF